MKVEEAVRRLRDVVQRRLYADELPWLEIAREILSCKRSVPPEGTERMTLIIGLRSVPHHDCRAALMVLTDKVVDSGFAP